MHPVKAHLVLILPRDRTLSQVREAGSGSFEIYSNHESLAPIGGQVFSSVKEARDAVRACLARSAK